MAFPVSASLLDAIVLAIVAREGTYGYKITQDVRKVMEVSDSTLYPVLRRLQRDGLLAAYDEAVDGRMRRYYRITPSGEVRLAQYRIEWAEYRKNIEQVLLE
ncbi:MAG: PadR family transcriptional regulator [Butyricicoccus sp.]